MKRRGGQPKAKWTLLDVVRRTKRRRSFTSRGNRLGAPAAVAFVERDLATAFITKQLRCACGGRLAFVRQLSHQVGVCASWRFACERNCTLPALETSKRLHGDDYLLNSKFNHACVTCALPYERAQKFCASLGFVAPSPNDFMKFKHEIEPVLRVRAEESMAAAHERNMRAGNHDYVSVDGGYCCLRNSSGCTMGAHAAHHCRANV